MKQKGKKNHRKIINFLVLLTMILVVLGTMFAFYISDSYSAESVAGEAIVSDDNEMVVKNENYVAFVPKNQENTTGFIFYPGAKVEYLAYAPLMRQLSQTTGAICILTKMPCNLAILDPFAVDNIIQYYPLIQDWYVGGHSLGGVTAAFYAANSEQPIKGLALLGAYSVNDISRSSMKVVTIYGEQDWVMSMDQYRSCRKNLPDGFTEYVIPGGNHAGFGCYGNQEGDGAATITGEEQRNLTVDAIAQWMQQ